MIRPDGDRLERRGFRRWSIYALVRSRRSGVKDIAVESMHESSPPADGRDRDPTTRRWPCSILRVSDALRCRPCVVVDRGSNAAIPWCVNRSFELTQRLLSTVLVYVYETENRHRDRGCYRRRLRRLHESRR